MVCIALFALCFLCGTLALASPLFSLSAPCVIVLTHDWSSLDRLVLFCLCLTLLATVGAHPPLRHDPAYQCPLLCPPTVPVLLSNPNRTTCILAAC